jgi:hypothetical protein
MKLREVEFWVKDKKFKGHFHTWGKRGDEELYEFFGIVEDEFGNCHELDACQIKFIKEI